MHNIVLRAYTAQNLGDDMFLEYICRRYPHVNFYLDCPAIFSQAFKSIPNLHLKILPSNKYDAQIVIGGSLFMQSNNKSVVEKYNLDLQQIKSIDAPTFILGANFGPFSDKKFADLYKEYFKLAKSVVFRDKDSYNLFNMPNCQWAPDILFNYKLPKSTKHKVIAISCIKKTMRTGLPEYNEVAYFARIASIIESYVKLEYRIYLTAFCTAQQDDVATKEIYAQLSDCAKERTEFLTYNGNIEEFLIKFLSASFIIGTRFHSIVLGLNADIPVLPISYNSKIINALNSYEFPCDIIRITDCSTLNFTLAEKYRLSDELVNITLLKKKAKLHFRQLDKFLGVN